MELSRTEWTDIGHGVSILPCSGVDTDEIVTILERHPCKTDAEHAGALPVRPHGRWPVWQVVAWDPLTLSPSVLCRTCGNHGWIREGRWEPA